MGLRLDLQTLLEGITPHVYFQPPTNTQIQYPCVIYQRDTELVDAADNIRYRHMKRYSVTVIDRNPDSSIPDQIAELPFCSFNRFFVADNLNHDVYNLFF